MSAPRRRPAQVPLVLRPGALTPRTLFLHFFDLHHLEELGDVTRSRRGRAEMDLVVRFAVIVGSRILVPAASYNENEVAASILKPFLDADETGSLFTLVGSGSSLAEFTFSKLDQYRPGSRQHTAYSRPGGAPDVAWRRRTRSASNDIANGWRDEGLEERLTKSLMPMWRRSSDEAAFRRAWRDVPERLGRDAFVVEHVEPFLSLPTANLVVTNTLHRVVNGLYFNSYAMDLGAAVFRNLGYLGGDAVPSGNPDDDVDYGALLQACRREGMLDRVRSCPVDQLESLAFDPTFQEVFAMSQPRPVECMPQDPGPQRVDLAIVTALPKELEAVEMVFGKGRAMRGRDDPHIYRIIDYEVGGRTRRIVVAVLSAMGNVRAGVTSTDLFRTFQPGLVVMVGIAGGCPDPTAPTDHVRLGDVVVGDSVLEYDNRKQTADRAEVRDSPQRVSYLWLQAAAQLRSEATGFDTRWAVTRDDALAELQSGAPHLPAADVLHDANGTRLDHPRDRRRDRAGAMVHVGRIAAGDTLLKDPAYRDALRAEHGARAVEMESAGLRDAAWSRSSGIGVVRGIVDYCDAYKSDEWHFTAAISAAAVTRLLFDTLMLAEP